jgi:6-pyruvoyltetrahydropterin/6-carboxytetrahydropterin synthase
LLLLTRTIHFNAAHRLWNPAKSEEWNYATFGPGANLAGYGHNYSLEIAVAGTANADTGMIVNLTDLDRILKEEVDRPLDHRHLNNEVAEFRDTVPTAENLALWIWRRVEARLTTDGWPCRLSSLVLKVTPTFSVELSAPAAAGS